MVNEAMLDEAPMAYKRLEDIIDVIRDSVDVIDVMKLCKVGESRPFHMKYRWCQNKNNPIDTKERDSYNKIEVIVMQDYSRYPDGNRYYSGVERKKSILISEKPYLVKFQKNSRDGLTFNYISEYLGSHIFSLLGIETQETFLGTYKGENVVVIQDFLGEDEVFVPFNGVGDSSLEQDKEKYQYSYEDIIGMLQVNIKLTDVDQTIELFWDMFIIDALIANFDRHGSNWGFIKKDNKYRLSPIFDNGSSLFPQLNTDEKLEAVLKNQEEIDMRIYKFPTSQVKYHGKKSSYYEIISSLEFEECNQALVRIVERIDFNKINQLIDSIENISEIRKTFYKTILKQRYEKILLESYHKLSSR